MLLVASFICALLVGRFGIKLSSFFGMLFGNGNYAIEKSIVLNLRLPRTIIAGLVGAALSVSGLLYQETFRNKLVSPDLLGVSSGAGVAAPTSPAIIVLGNLRFNTMLFSIA